MNVLLNEEWHSEEVRGEKTPEAKTKAEILNESGMSTSWCYRSLAGGWLKDMGFRAKVTEAGEDEALGLHKAGSFKWDLRMLPMYEPSQWYSSKHGIVGNKNLLIATRV